MKKYIETEQWNHGLNFYRTSLENILPNTPQAIFEIDPTIAPIVVKVRIDKDSTSTIISGGLDFFEKSLKNLPDWCSYPYGFLNSNYQLNENDFFLTDEEFNALEIQYLPKECSIFDLGHNINLITEEYEKISFKSQQINTILTDKNILGNFANSINLSLKHINTEDFIDFLKYTSQITTGLPFEIKIDFNFKNISLNKIEELKEIFQSYLTEQISFKELKENLQTFKQLATNKI